MASIFPEMTDKMQDLYMDIVEALRQMPPERKVFIFGIDEDEDLDWIMAVANYITLEFIKYSYDYNDPVYPLRHFLDNNDDSERMLQSRIVKYVLKYKKKELERAPNLPPYHKYSDIDMDNMEQKLKGYRFTEMNYFEHQNIHDLEIIKAIVEKRIVSSKKVSNQHFEEMFEQYDKMVEELMKWSLRSDHDMVFTSLALFTLEWKFAIETLYHIAWLMEDKGIKTIDQSTLILICGGVMIESQFGDSVITDSSMVMERLYVLDFLFDNKNKWPYKQSLIDLIKEILVIGVRFREAVETEDGEPYKEWFRKESTEEDWASFFRYYNIFSIWQKKEWTRKRIQNMRVLYDLIIRPKE